MKLKGESIVVFGGSDWWAHVVKPEHARAQYLSQENKVLFINSIGIGMPGGGANRLGRRILKKLQSMASGLRILGAALGVLSLFFIPVWNVRLIAAFNRRLILWRISRAMRKLGIENPIIIASLPTARLFIDHIPNKLLLYNMKDLFGSYYEKMNFTVVSEHDAEMQQLADCITTPSIGIAERMKTQNDCIRYIPHGVNEAFFDDSAVEPDWFAGIPEPRILYFGQMENLLDAPLLQRLAEREPKWQFVLVGNKQSTYEELEAMRNVHFVPVKPQRELAAAGRNAAALIMPWQETEWIRYSCPIKFREYLAIGKPVVSVPIIEVEKAYPGMAATARTAHEWHAALKEAVTSNTPERDEARRKLVEGYTIQRFAEIYSGTLHELLERKCAE
ncbi:MAG: hypothetical protein CL946_13755 [Ectothiorhodospiraceae bacterium]|nr:hypothetical protein [Ectothiorhodospiraceae bacterium]